MAMRFYLLFLKFRENFDFIAKFFQSIVLPFFNFSSFFRAKTFKIMITISVIKYFSAFKNIFNKCLSNSVNGIIIAYIFNIFLRHKSRSNLNFSSVRTSYFA
ncbi:GSCOCG00012449001-RA-CDS [Cotesia congregata]|nr:GSCOCG00012449001-RA-CDS [Cotesia congregata]